MTSVAVAITLRSRADPCGRARSTNSSTRMIATSGSPGMMLCSGLRAPSIVIE